MLSLRHLRALYFSSVIVNSLFALIFCLIWSPGWRGVTPFRARLARPFRLPWHSDVNGLFAFNSRVPSLSLFLILGLISSAFSFCYIVIFLFFFKTFLRQYSVPAQLSGGRVGFSLIVHTVKVSRMKFFSPLTELVSPSNFNCFRILSCSPNTLVFGTVRKSWSLASK